jgi:hypothetical protein
MCDQHTHAHTHGVVSQGLDFSQYKPGNAMPFKKPKEEAADAKQSASRKGAAAKPKAKDSTGKKGGKDEAKAAGAADAVVEGEASRSETRTEVHTDVSGDAAPLPPKHTAGEGEEGGEQ